ncbi:cyclic nucleotide-binding domain-containing protein 1 [Astyanax mexicanus]|uniref:cyclic nucleotide-binding domain-containing protein 1 n=1 Tax=Astyanax mexicanus TaxID=7994 RepID=UPI0020CAB714|nr:cyclic nucleotide-binding domain-containing protein 1 [Astyanax mexicanus]
MRTAASQSLSRRRGRKRLYYLQRCFAVFVNCHGNAALPVHSAVKTSETGQNKQRLQPQLTIITLNITCTSFSVTFTLHYHHCEQPEQQLPAALLDMDGQRIIGINYPQLRALCGISGLSESGISQSSVDAHEEFMNLYQKIFLQPKKIPPGIPLGRESNISHASQTLKAMESQARQERNRNRPQEKQTQEMLINHAIRALKKLPIERSQKDLQVILKMLKMFPCLSTQLPKQELNKISSIGVVETWDRSQILFGHDGFFLMLKGSVKPYTRKGSREDQNKPAIGVGGFFGSFEPPQSEDSGNITQCALTLEVCEIFKISHSGYAKLKEDIAAKDHAMKESLIKSCQYYLSWPKLSIHHLTKLIQLKTFPANQVLVKEGRVCSFVAYIREGECTLLQDIGALIHPAKKKGVGIKSVVVGRLGCMESFGEVSVLQEQPSPCTIITSTELQAGIIQPEALRDLDSVTISLMLQTAQPTCRKLSQEEITKEYMRQEKSKEWDHIKKRVLSDALFYNGIQLGCGK